MYIAHDYALMCVAKWRDGEMSREIPAGHVALHDSDVTTYVYDVLGDLPAWREWARSVFEQDDPIAIGGSGNTYWVETMPVDQLAELSALVEAGDDAGYSAAVAAWVREQEG